MTYTHCRGCGGALRKDSGEVDDGLCGALVAYDRCCGKFHQWLSEKLGTEAPTSDAAFRSAEGRFWESPMWSVAIDEWLAATR